MKIKNFKKKILSLGAILLIAGLALAFLGLSQNNFSTTPYEEANGHRWYQTLYLEDGQWTFGVTITPSLNIPKIGGSSFTLVMIHGRSSLPAPPNAPNVPNAPNAPN
jgi:hypothetical protein